MDEVKLRRSLSKYQVVERLPWVDRQVQHLPHFVASVFSVANLDAGVAGRQEVVPHVFFVPNLRVCQRGSMMTRVNPNYSASAICSDFVDGRRPMRSHR